jgi:hypothetical protein
MAARLLVSRKRLRKLVSAFRVCQREHDVFAFWRSVSNIQHVNLPMLKQLNDTVSRV